jgi:hypothetical protein
MKISDFPRFMEQLGGDPFGWAPNSNLSLDQQDKYLEELHIPTCNGFKDFLFWDVVQVLLPYIIQLLGPYKDVHGQT